MLFSSNSNANFRKKSGSFSERANMALSSLQRNSNAMNLLRSRLESKINRNLANPNIVQDSQQLAKMLELVKIGESVIEEMSSKVESAKFLEEFVVILDNAANSVREITTDMESMVPAAESALEEMHDTILRTSMGLSKENERESKLIMDEAASVPQEDYVSSAKEIEPEVLSASVNNSSLVSKEKVPEGIQSPQTKLQNDCELLDETAAEPVPA